MGSLRSIISKIPGISQKINDEEIDDRQVDRLCAIILSMTPGERQNQISSMRQEKKNCYG